MEICLDIMEYREQRNGYLYLQPKGGVVVGVTQKRIRAKWVEIFGELLRPKKKHLYEGIPGFDIITEAWKPQWYNSWRDMVDRKISADEAWAQITEDGILDSVPTDPRGDVPLTDTWLWSSIDGIRSRCERKRFLILNLDYEDEELPTAKAEYEVAGKTIVGPTHQIDYEIDLSLSGDSLSNINDPNTLFHPRLNYVIASSFLKDLRLGGEGR